jgi:hypothetical protein
VPIHVCVACDEDGCGRAQSAGFDRRDETYGDLLDALAEAGWEVGEDGRLRCPECAGRRAPEPRDPS